MPTQADDDYKLSAEDSEVKYKDKPNEVLYFTNRLEIGMDSVYEKLEYDSHILNETENYM